MGRRAKGEGSAEQRGKSWISRRTVDGVRVYGKTWPTKSQALAEARTLGRTKPLSSLTVAEYMATLVEGEWKSELAPKTFELYGFVHAVHVETAPIGAMLLGAVKPTDIENWLRNLRKRTVLDGGKVLLEPLMPSSKARYLTALRSVFTRAVKAELILANPAAKVRKPVVPETVKQVLTPDDVAFILSHDMSPRLRAAMELSLVGLRLGEILGARWDDVTKDGYLLVRRQVQEAQGELIVMPHPKGAKERRVKLDDSALEALAAIKFHSTGYVFAQSKLKGNHVLSSKTTDPTRPMRPSNLQRLWDAHMKRCGFSGFGRHDARSTIESIMFESGADVRATADLMGHSPETALKHYVRSQQSRRDEILRVGRDTISAARATNRATKEGN